MVYIRIAFPLLTCFLSFLSSINTSFLTFKSTYQPSKFPSFHPIDLPLSNFPTFQPSNLSNLATFQPSTQSTFHLLSFNLPTFQFSTNRPSTFYLSNLPTFQPSNLPTFQPPTQSTFHLLSFPTFQPSNLSNQPINMSQASIISSSDPDYLDISASPPPHLPSSVPIFLPKSSPLLRLLIPRYPKGFELAGFISTCQILILNIIERLTLVAPLWLRLAVVTTGTRRSVPQDSQ